MILPQDERFRDERNRFRLRFTCEECVHFVEPDSELPTGRCNHGFPCHRHLTSRYDDPEADLLFCKEFELR